MTGPLGLEQIIQHVGERPLEALDRDIAWSLGARITALLREQSSAAALEVVRCGVVAFDWSPTDAMVRQRDRIHRKRAVGGRFGRSSLWVKLSSQRGFQEPYRLRDSDYAAVGGVFPVHAAGGHVGTVITCGMASEVDAHRMFTAFIREIQASQRHR